MKVYWISGLILLSLIGCAGRSVEKPVAREGIIDLSSWDYSQNLPLEGEWLFYWKEFLPSETIDQAANGAKVPVPGDWKDYSLPGEKPGSQGWGTFRLTLKGLPPDRALALYIPEQSTAYNLFINNQKIATAGSPGRTKEESRPSYGNNMIGFRTEAETVELIIHISNFHHQKGGIWDNIYLGDRIKVQNYKYLLLLKEAFLSGSLLIMALYYLILFLFRQQEKEKLLFSLFCLVSLIRQLFSGEYAILDLFPAFPWEWLAKTEYLTLPGLALTFLLFTWALFPGEIPKLGVRILILFSALYSLFILVTPALIYSRSVLLPQVVILIVLIIIFIGIAKAIKRKREGALLFLGGIVIITIAFVNDILNNFLILFTGYLANYGTFLFFLLLSGVMGLKSVTAYKRSEILGEAVTHSNRELKSLLDEIRVSSELLGRKESLMAEKTGEAITAAGRIDREIISGKQVIEQYGSGLKQTISAIEEITRRLASYSGEIEGQQQTIQSSSDAIEGMVYDIQATITHFSELENTFHQLETASESGRNCLNAIHNSIARVAAESEIMGEINSRIRDIADSTNILGINASIEAAHAGASGKGFGVVAKEVKKLAVNSLDQSRKIEEELKTIKTFIREVVEAGSSSEQAFSHILTLITGMAPLLVNIRTIVTGQQQHSRNVLEKLTAIQETTSRTGAHAEGFTEKAAEAIASIGELQNLSSGVEESFRGIFDATARILSTIKTVEETGKETKSAVTRLLGFTEQSEV